MSAARNTLAHVASRLNAHGTTRILWGNTLELDGVPVLFVNLSDALVYLPIGSLRSSDARKGADAAEIAESIEGRMMKAGYELSRRAA
jgi:hypothetical protein